MPGDLTREERLIRTAFISEAAPRHPGDYLAAIREGVSAFRAHKARLSRPVNETTTRSTKPAAPTLSPAAIAAIAEALAPRPTAAAATGGATTTVAIPVHELAAEQLAVATAEALHTGRSPFWRGINERAPVPPITETAQPTVPDVPLHEMDSDQLAAHTAATFGAHGRAHGFGSPGWRG